MPQLPKVSNYGQYESDNYGAHTLAVDLGTITLYYSYKTIIAYEDPQDGLVCSTNAWSVATGKHLDWIQGNKKARVPHAEFCTMLEQAIARHIS